MTIDEFKEMMCCNEPDFAYNGERYSICWPGGRYYVTASDRPGDTELEFETLDDLLEHWIIQGRRFRDILPDIDLG